MITTLEPTAGPNPTKLDSSTKGGIVAALLAKGYSPEHGPFPPSLREVQAATVFTLADDEFANYLIHDTDCGGAWNDAAQIEAATQGGAQ